MRSLGLQLYGVHSRANLKIEAKKMGSLVFGMEKVLVWIGLWMFLNMLMQLAPQNMEEF